MVVLEAGCLPLLSSGPDRSVNDLYCEFPSQVFRGCLGLAEPRLHICSVAAREAGKGVLASILRSHRLIKWGSLSKQEEY